MPAKDLGNKFVCFKCGSKFYDLKKPDPVCPKCGTDQRESPALRPQPEGKRSRLAAVPKAAEPVDLGEEEPIADEESESFEDEDSDAEASTDDDES